MKQLYSYPEEWLRQRQALHTAREIHQQPWLWRRLTQRLHQLQPQWQPFLQTLLRQPDLRIVLCGAGSSDYIGRALAPWLCEATGRDVVACATTDIVPAPLHYLHPTRPTLLVSYGRSGNSPESLAAVTLADRMLPDCHHLVITCNAEGELARFGQNRQRARTLLMPSEALDQGFAMTSSFSCMLLATLLTLGPWPLAQSDEMLQSVADWCDQQQASWQQQCKPLARGGFTRVVCLGAGCLSGVAQEAALKILELTAGRIASRYDTPLGLRHGPKFMIDGGTLVLLLLSTDPYRHGYERDLLHELRKDGLARRVVALSGDRDADMPETLAVAGAHDDIWLSLPYLVFLQLLALETALALGVTPDNPCPSGEVNRVVQGVTLYPYPTGQGAWQRRQQEEDA